MARLLGMASKQEALPRIQLTQFSADLGCKGLVSMQASCGASRQVKTSQTKGLRPQSLRLRVGVGLQVKVHGPKPKALNPKS